MSPLFVLTLLAHAPGMRGIAAGGTLAYARRRAHEPVLLARSQPAAKVVGIDCVAELFGTDEHDRLAAPAGEGVVRERDATSIYTSSPSLVPIAATFSRFLNGYAARCSETQRAER